jgi:hypothetical protein
VSTPGAARAAPAPLPTTGVAKPIERPLSDADGRMR